MTGQEMDALVNNTVRTAREVSAAILLTGAVALLLLAATSLHQPCRTLDLSEDAAGNGVTGRQVAALMQQGWWSDPSDHAERLYAPACAH